MTTENFCVADIIIVAFNICELELLMKAFCFRDFSVITFSRDSKVIVREYNMDDLPMHLRGKSNPQIMENARHWQSDGSG
jgi:5'(3')-deoxyribonucleotidase